MLVDLTTPYEGILARLDTGLYQVLSWKAKYNLLTLENGWLEFEFQYPELQHGNVLEYWAKRSASAEYFCTYGSCDSPEQFMSHSYSQAIQASEHPYLVAFTHETKEFSSGRRWHKNGPHIGLKEPQCEHFGDEPEISEIYSFNIYRKQV